MSDLENRCTSYVWQLVLKVAPCVHISVVWAFPVHFVKIFLRFLRLGSSSVLAMFHLHGSRRFWRLFLLQSLVLYTLEWLLRLRVSIFFLHLWLKLSCLTSIVVSSKTNNTITINVSISPRNLIILITIIIKNYTLI